MNTKTKILIVEDEWMIAEVAQVTLSKMGYEVVSIATSGDEAIRKAEECMPDLVLMDIVLEGKMDGIEAARQIHSRFDIPIIFQTAYSDEKMLERTREIEPFGYLIKPVKERELYTSIKMALYKHELDEKLKDNEKKLTASLDDAMRRRAEVSALLDSARAVLKDKKFAGAARSIFDNAKKLTGATAGYVALLTPDGQENEVLFLDSGGRPCTVNPDLPMPIRGLRAEAYHSGKVVYDNHFSESQWIKFMPEGHARLDNVLFAPLVLEGKTVGLMGLANKPEGFNDNDARLAAAFAEHAALALYNSRMLETLENSEARLLAVAESALDAIISIDSSGKIVSWNKAAEEAFGFSQEEAQGKALAFIMPERFREAHAKGIERVKSGGEFHVIGKTVELMGLKKDGSEFPLELSLSTWEVGGKRFFSGLLHDITERKKREESIQKNLKELQQINEKLQKAQALLVRQEKLASVGTLSAGVAHEILNPLNIMSTTIQVMQMEELPKEIKENLDVIMQQIHRATKITNNLRMFAHKKEAKVEPVDLHVLFDKTASLMEHDLQLENILIDRKFAPDLPLIEADEDELAQVFMNFITNARGAMKGGKENYITIQTKVMEGMVEIRFSDTGTGIPKSIINKIFDPFFTTKNPGQGTGLGLSVVHSIIEKHNGSVIVESEEGKGTTFIVTLPVGGKA